MLQSNILEVYPTTRAIRERLEQRLKSDCFLPKSVTIAEFENKAVIIEGKTRIDEESRIALMQEASKFENFKELKIEREFFAFLKNSSYLFSFFEELAVEMTDIKELKNFDTYAHYHEHLEILDTLAERYKTLLEENDLFDKMTIPYQYKLNDRYIKSFDSIELFLEGYLSKFEVALLWQVAEITTLVIHLHTNAFNKKMIDLFREKGFPIESGFYYKLDISKNKILKHCKTENKNINYEIASVESKIEQIAYIKKKVYDFIQAGHDPEKIAVILPVASLSELIDLFDEENNFNFAMGSPYKKCNLFKKLNALYDFYNDPNYENRYRLVSLGYDLQEVYEMTKEWNKSFSAKEAANLIENIVKKSDDETYEIFQNELYLFSKLLPQITHYPFVRLLHLFISRLSKKSIDDTRGGKITVMEILETRAVKKDAVIIVDFNEGILPGSNKKDLFLTSSIRSACDLPTPSDRENLQKYYYKRVFDRARDVAVCFVSDEQNQPSRFLDELFGEYELTRYDDLKKILLPFNKRKTHFIQKDLILKYDFEKTELSPTKLKTFLQCKRKYYFRYIKKLKEFEIPKDEESERIIGTYLHEALKYTYMRQEFYEDEKELLLNLQRYLYGISEKNASLRFIVDIWLQKLKLFVSNEISRFRDGFKVLGVEKSMREKFHHLTLQGNIDRIDIKDGKLYIIDYKSGKIPKTTARTLQKSNDFQLQFYYLLLKNHGEIFDAFYYDLNGAQLIDEPMFDEKLDLLYKHFDELKKKEFNFLMCEDLKICQFCEYNKICNRIL